MKRAIATVIVAAMLIGMLAGCKSKDITDPGATAVTVTPISTAEPTVAPTKAPEPEPTKVLEATPKVTPEATPEVTPEITPEAEPTAIPLVREYGTIIENDEGRTEEWNWIINLYNDFLTCNERASGLYRLSDRFKMGYDYSIYEIGEGFKQHLDEEFMYEHVLSSVKYAIIEGPDNPYLALRFVYEDPKGYDLPYEETMFFYCDYGWVCLAGSVTSYYREYATVNERGYCSVYGSSGANRGSSANYCLGDEGAFIHVNSEQEVFCLAEPKLDIAFMPSDTTLDISDFNSSDYSDHGYTLRAVTFTDINQDRFIDDYDAFLRTYYYVFYDFDGNNVMPDADYVARCEADGLDIITEAELNEHFDFQEDFYYLTDSDKNAPELIFTNDIPKEAWSDARGVFGQLQLFADNMDTWLISDNDAEMPYSCYAVTDLDYDRHYELISAAMDFWTGDVRYHFYEVNDDYTGIAEEDYTEQFTDEDGYVSGWQPNLVNAEDIRCYSGSGTYYYVIPTEYVYDTFAESRVDVRYEVLSKEIGSSVIVYEGCTGGHEYVTTYDENGAVVSDTERYYRWDDEEITEEAYKTINKAYFDFDPDGYNIIEFEFDPMMVGSEDNEQTCFDALLMSLYGHGGAYVYSPTGE